MIAICNNKKIFILLIKIDYSPHELHTWPDCQCENFKMRWVVKLNFLQSKYFFMGLMLFYNNDKNVIHSYHIFCDSEKKAIIQVYKKARFQSLT